MIIRNLNKIVFILFAGLIISGHSATCAESKFLETIKVSDNVYVFKPKIDWVHSNCVAVIGSESILIVDTFIQSNYADEAIRLLKEISNLPVRYVVNTHWHNDHVMGNYAFKKAFPDCKVVMHDSTYVYMAKNISKAIENEEASMKNDIESTEKELAEGKRSNGYPLTPPIAAFWKWTVEETKEYQKNYKPNKLVNGEILFSNTMTLNLGTEKVTLIHAEEDGHSKGDVIVWIADKKLLITGDIIVGPTPYATGANISGMIKSIQKVIDMNPSTIIPGHGVILHDLSYPKLLVELFSEMSTKSQEAVSQKIPVKEAMDGKVIVPKDLAFKFTKGDEVKEMALHAWFTRWIVYNTYRNSGALPKKS